MVHKNVKPSTYQCNLCALTFDNVGMKDEWEKFIENLNADIEFLHRDEFSDEFRVEEIDLPAAFIKKDDSLEVFISSDEMNKCESLDELKVLVKKKLGQI